MTWTVEVSRQARRHLERLDRTARDRIERFMEERLETEADPRRFGQTLQGDLSGLWRYRIGDYRLICRIEEGRCVVLALAVGHRREIYRAG